MISRMPLRPALAALAVLCLPADAAASQTAPADRAAQRILVLHQERPTRPMSALNNGLVSAVRTDTTVQREVFIEYLDYARSVDTALMNAHLNFLRLKYEQQPIDVAVAVGPVSHRILTDADQTIAPGAEILFWSMGPELEGPVTHSVAASGIVAAYDVAGTARDILTLLPDTRKLLVVSGVTSLDSIALRQGVSQLRRLHSFLEIEQLVGATQQEFLKRAAAMPPNSAILLLNFIGDSLGQKYFPTDVTTAAARVSNAPIFAVTRTLLGSGVVGGRMLDHEEHGRLLGELALTVLRGDSLPAAVVSAASQHPVYDGRALRRWGISPNRLPPDAEVLFREDIPWDHYNRRILAVLTLCVVEALLIGGMLVQRRRRRRAERLLADRLHFETVLADASRTFADVHPRQISTETTRWLRRLCTMTEARQAAILQFERDGVHLRRAEAWRSAGATDNVTSRIGVDALIELKSGHVTTTRVHPDAPCPILVLIPIALEGCTTGILLIEARSSRLFGQSVPLDRSRVLGEILAGANARKHAATELARHADALRASHMEYRRLADSLVEAQEKERRRIARELHDDIAQRLALLSLEAGEMGRRAGDPAIVPRSAIEHLTRELGTLVTDMSRVSHRLHPSVLEKIGLSAALRSLADDLKSCCRTPIAFEERDVPPALPAAGALTLYRVAQEALRNAIRHSGATCIVMRLIHADGTLTLEVLDNGQGLDVERVRRGPGLGITSMAERVEVLGGCFSIQSRSGAGTVVRAAIRLQPEGAAGAKTGNSIETALR